VSRTVTPDQSLSNFATLQPSGPLEPSGRMSPYSTPMQPKRPTPQTQTSASGGAIDWNAAAGTRSASAWSTNHLNSAPAMTPSYNSTATSSSSNNIWAIPSPAVQPSTATAFPQQAGAFTIAPPPRSPYQNFGIVPPPAQQLTTPGGLGMTAQNQMQGGQSGQKQGMDKYESLL
jgi:SCY1-like protein 2